LEGKNAGKDPDMHCFFLIFYVLLNFLQRCGVHEEGNQDEHHEGGEWGRVDRVHPVVTAHRQPCLSATSGLCQYQVMHHYYHHYQFFFHAIIIIIIFIIIIVTIIIINSKIIIVTIIIIIIAVIIIIVFSIAFSLSSSSSSSSSLSSSSSSSSLSSSLNYILSTKASFESRSRKNRDKKTFFSNKSLQLFIRHYSLLSTLPCRKGIRNCAFLHSPNKCRARETQPGEDEE
jgi:ABC-type multidrug transport system fused ATPase/permease subunit